MVGTGRVGGIGRRRQNTAKHFLRGGIVNIVFLDDQESSSVDSRKGAQPTGREARNTWPKWGECHRYVTSW